MAGRRLELHPGAKIDYLAAIEWYLERSSGVARQFQLQVTRAFDRLVEQPDLPAADAAGIRWLRLKSFPYIVYFRLKVDGSVQVLAIAHGRRRPRYWRQRMG